MKHIFLKPENKKGFAAMAIVIAIIVVILLIIIIFTMAAAFIGDRQGANSNGEMITGNSAGGAGAGTVDCGKSNITKMTAEQYQWVKDAANKFMNGDEAALIAMIQIESSWDPQATYGGHATGLGQFEPSTARGKSYPQFNGGVAAGITWSPGTIYPISTGHPDDARFDTKRSIYAAAQYIGFAITAENGSVGAAYEEHYHGYCKANTQKCQDQKAEAQKGRQRLEEYYNKLKSNGQCTVSAPSNTATGASDGSCLPVAFIHENRATYCGKASQAQVVNYFNTNQYPSPTSPTFQENNGLSAETTNRLSKKPYIGTGPNASNKSAYIEAAINSIQKGFPVIVYTDVYGKHIFVLTGYDSATQTFKANDTMNGIHGNFQTTCTSVMGGPGGVLLTKANLMAHLVPQANYFILVK